MIGDTPLTLGQAVEDALIRLKSAFPAHHWSPDSIREYRRALTDMGDVTVVSRAVSTVIDKTEERYPPPVGIVVSAARELTPTTKANAGAPMFVEAAPHPYDPPGTVRYVVIQPDGRRIPPGARIAGEV